MKGVALRRSVARAGLVSDGGPPRCPACSGRLVFKTDRLGRMMEQCGCGYGAHVLRRDGKPVVAEQPTTPEA
jgi:hypothetical protein